MFLMTSGQPPPIGHMTSRDGRCNKMAASMEGTQDSEISSSHPPHPFYDHPKIHEMRSFGFGNEEQMKQSLLVYLDLLEAKRWWNMHVVPCSGLRQILVCGQSSQHEGVEVVLPVRQDNELSVHHLQQLLTTVKAEHGSSTLTLALMDSESSIVYYKISDGFIPPDPPESIQEKKKQRQRKFQHRRARFIQASRHVDNVRERYFGVGAPNSSHNSPQGGSTVQNEAQSKDCGMADASEFNANPQKRQIEDETDHHQGGAKHMKLDTDSENIDNSSLLLQPPQPPDSSSNFNQAGPSYENNDQQNRLFEPQPNGDHGGAHGGAHGGEHGGAPHGGSPKKEDEGVQVGVAMVQAPVMEPEHDSDHDSGMDAGEDDEDEGFDEEL